MSCSEIVTIEFEIFKAYTTRLVNKMLIALLLQIIKKQMFQIKGMRYNVPRNTNNLFFIYSGCNIFMHFCILLHILNNHFNDHLMQ